MCRDDIPVLVDGNLNDHRSRSVGLLGNRWIRRFWQTDGLAIEHTARDWGPWYGRGRWRWFVGDVHFSWPSCNTGTATRTNWQRRGSIGVATADDCSHALSNWRNVAGLR